MRHQRPYLCLLLLSVPVLASGACSNDVVPNGPPGPGAGVSNGGASSGGSGAANVGASAGATTAAGGGNSHAGSGGSQPSNGGAGGATSGQAGAAVGSGGTSGGSNVGVPAVIAAGVRWFGRVDVAFTRRNRAVREAHRDGRTHDARLGELLRAYELDVLGH